MKKETKEKVSYILRSATLIVLMVSLGFLSVVRLLQIQIVNPPTEEQIMENYTATQMIQAARGQIADKEGRKLNTNKIVYKIILQRAFLPFGGENEAIAGTLSVLIKHKEEWIDSIPITAEAPYKFKNVGEEELDKFKTRLKLNLDATVENCMKALAGNYKIDAEKYDEQMIRFIGGIRYEMELRDFSYANRYTLAEDVSFETIIEMKEKSIIFSGVDVVEEPMRVYLEGTDLPHIRGRINAISAEKYAELKDSGYNYNDVIGFFGIESTMESTLRGHNGTRQIVRDMSGNVISDEIIDDVKAGNSVKLTIDIEFQRTIETILENQISWLHTNTLNPRGENVTAGAVAVIDVKTGAVLALANYPSYDLNDYIELMLAEVAGDPLLEYTPLINRAACKPYRPGSAFKTITATAGLINGVIGRNDTVFCNGTYRFFDDFQPKCTGSHGSINVVMGLKWSCNCFFYDVGRRVRIDRLDEMAENFGVGTRLTNDIECEKGRMTTPEIYKELQGIEINDGDTIQAAIGQSETELTPLHMATVAMTLANKGVRYRPYLVDSVWNYDCSELVYETMPEIVADFSEGNADYFNIILEGMIEVSKNADWPIGSGKNHFDYLPDNCAYKTGTPELINNRFNSTVLGFYPAHDPQIAFGIVLEDGEYSRYMVRNIIDAYFYNYEPDYNNDGEIANPWKRWSGPREPVKKY